MNGKTIIEAINEIAESLAEFAEAVRHLLGEYLSDMPELPELAKPKHWLPVRYIGVNDRRTDRRPQVHRIRNALPNMYRDRRKKRKGD